MAVIPSWNPKDYVRVIKLASKPKNSEMKMVGGVAGAGIALIGILGVIIYTAMSFIPV